MGSGATACQAGSSLRPSTWISPWSRGSGQTTSRDAAEPAGCWPRPAPQQERSYRRRAGARAVDMEPKLGPDWSWQKIQLRSRKLDQYGPLDILVSVDR